MAQLPITRQVELIGEALRGPIRRQIIREVAEQKFAEHRTHNRAVAGRDLPESIATDGVIGRPPEEMRVGGSSVLTSGDVVDWLPAIIAELKAASPRGRSNSKPDEQRYASSHVVLVDGQDLGPPYLLPPVWRRIVIVSTSPYTRKIERGSSSQRPDGVYESIVFPSVERRLASTRYDVSFAWVGDVVGAFGKRSAIRTVVRSRRNVRRRRRIYDASRRRIPAIIIERSL